MSTGTHGAKRGQKTVVVMPTPHTVMVLSQAFVPEATLTGNIVVVGGADIRPPLHDERPRPFLPRIDAAVGAEDQVSIDRE